MQLVKFPLLIISRKKRIAKIIVKSGWLLISSESCNPLKSMILTLYSANGQGITNAVLQDVMREYETAGAKTH